MMPNKAICWDMDDTLGYFTPLHYEKRGIAAPAYLPKAGLRHGIKSTLQELICAGYSNFVTTSATLENAEFKLRRTGLEGYFQGIFSRELIYDTGTGKSKRYRPIAQKLGFSDAEAIENIMVVGDGEIDMASDLDGLVLIMDASIWKAAGYANPKLPVKAIDSGVIRAVIDEIARNGLGFNSGFKRLYEESEIFEESKHLQYTHKIFNLNNNIRFKLCYSPLESRSSRTAIPIIFDINGAEMELQPIYSNGA